MTKNCILCNVLGEDFGTKPEYNKYDKADPTGVSYGIKRHYSFLKCPKCNLWWVKDPEENYEDIYKSTRYWNEYNKDFRGLLALTERFDNDIKYAKLRVPEILRYVKKGKSLDIGCSNGTLVKELSLVGFDALGMELNDEICKLAMEYSGCFVCNNLDSFKNNDYDFVSAIDVLEHLENPLETVKKWVDKVKTGGILFLEAPDSGCSHALNAGIYWDYVCPGEHLYYYSKEHIKSLLLKFNCLVIEEVNVFTTDRLRIVARKLF